MKLDAEAIVAKALEVIKDKLMTQPIHAEIVCQQLLKAIPDHPEGLHLLGLIKQKFQQYDESIIIIEKAIAVDPDNPDNYNNIALAYANLGKYEKSIEFLEEAISKKNNYLYYNNLALQYRQVGKHEIAIQLFEKAISLSPDPQLWNNLGGVYGELKDLENAARCFRKAMEIDPNFAAAHVDLAFTCHLDGRWQEGFAEYEWRFKHFTQLNHYLKNYDQSKLWNGVDSLDGKTILLYGEQGLGDVIQFSRYIKKVKALGAKTILHCPEATECLMKRIEGVDETVVRDIVTKDNVEFPPYDYQCSIMSLPHLLQDFEISGKPYLKPLATLKLKDQEEYKDTFNVGLVWAGSPAHPNDATRSMYLRDFRPIHDMEGVKLFNLQVQHAKRIYPFGKKIVDLTAHCDDMKLVDMTSMIQNFDDTATIITGLDLVIAVDTAIVHLAGSLGVPCWMLIPYNPDWRWGMESDKTPWYDSVRIFRQETRDQWYDVVEQVKQELKKVL